MVKKAFEKYLREVNEAYLRGNVIEQTGWPVGEVLE